MRVWPDDRSTVNRLGWGTGRIALRAMMGLMGLIGVQAALAEIPRDTRTALSASGLKALNEGDLAQVHGAGLDTTALMALGQAADKSSGKDQDVAREQAREQAAKSTTGMATTLAAALELQGRMAPQLAATGVNVISSAALSTSSLAVAAPVVIPVLSLPLLGVLPTLPSAKGH